MSKKITREELTELLSENMPIDVVCLLMDVEFDRTDGVYLTGLRKVLDLRAQAWHREQLNKTLAVDRITELEAEVSRLGWDQQPMTTQPTRSYPC